MITRVTHKTSLFHAFMGITEQISFSVEEDNTHKTSLFHIFMGITEQISFNVEEDNTHKTLFFELLWVNGSSL